MRQTLVTLASAGLFSGVSSTTQYLAGYQTASDVQNHANIDLDQKAIEDCKSDFASMDDGYDDWEACATKYYTEGGNSAKGDGYRTIQGFSTSGPDKFTDLTPANKFLAYYSTYEYADNFITDALDETGVWEDIDSSIFKNSADSSAADELATARHQAVKKGTAYMATLMYALYEYNVPYRDLLTGTVAEDDTGDDGHVHTWDEGWAFWAGSLESGSGDGSSPYTLAEKRDSNFGTALSSAMSNGGTAMSNEKILAASDAGRDLLADISAGTVSSADQASITLANECIQRQAFIGVIQGCIKYGYEAKTCTADCGGEYGEVYTFCAAMAPLLNSVSSTDATTVMDYATIGGDDSTFLVAEFSTFRNAIYDNINDMGYTIAEIGVYTEDDYTMTDSMPDTYSDYCADYSIDDDDDDDSDDDVCFSGDDTVTLESGLSVSFAELKVGDRILTADKTGNTDYSDVVFLPHGANNKPATFVEMTTSTGSKLRATKSHLIVTCSGATATAGSLTVGQCVRTVSGDDAIETLATVRSTGIYTAVTKSDYLVVGGVVASPFALNHNMVSAYYNIHRVAYDFLPSLLLSPVLMKANELLGSFVAHAFVAVAGK